MSAIIFLQEAATITIPVWQGLTGIGVISSIGFAMNSINNSKLAKKVDKDVFEAHEKDNEKQHKDIIHIRDRLDGYLDGLKKK